MDARKVQKLTENILYQRIKSCPRDLSKITQLNITGRHLVDVSLLKKLPGLEILSLSVNKITSLMYFKYCRKLKALFLRQNRVKDLSEIKYLMNLPDLSMFSLFENPCATDPNYRLTIIKNLKNLKELDDIPVLPEEKRRALKYGKEYSEDIEPFIKSSPSTDDLSDINEEDQDLNQCGLPQMVSLQSDTQSKEIEGVGEGDTKDETDKKTKKSNTTVKLIPELHSSSSCHTDPKTVQSNPCESKTGEVPSNSYSAVRILMKELDRSELEALYAEVGALLKSSLPHYRREEQPV